MPHCPAFAFYLPKVKVNIAQSYLTLCDPMDYRVHGILRARILEWVAYPFSRGSSQPRDQTQISHTAGDSLWSEPPEKPKNTGVGNHYHFSRGSSQPGIEPRSPALQADSSPSELPGKPTECSQIEDKNILLSEKLSQ